MLFIDDGVTLGRTLDMEFMPRRSRPATPRRSQSPHAAAIQENPTLSRATGRAARRSQRQSSATSTSREAPPALTARVYPMDRSPSDISRAAVDNAPQSARGAMAVHRLSSIRKNQDYALPMATTSEGLKLPQIGTQHAPIGANIEAQSHSGAAHVPRHPHALHTLPHTLSHHLELKHVSLTTESEVRDIRTELTSVVMPAARLWRAPGMALDRGLVEEMELRLVPQQVVAASQFSERHCKWYSRATRLLSELENEPTAGKKSFTFDEATQWVRSNRLYVEMPLPPDPPLSPSPRNKYFPSPPRDDRWRLDKSIWADRKRTSNSKDYYETPAALGSLMGADWAVAQRSKGLYKDVFRSASEEVPPPELVNMKLEALTEAAMASSAKEGGGRGQGGDGAAASGPVPVPCVGGPDGEVARTLRVLTDRAPLIYGTFDYYSAAYSLDVGGPLSRNEADIFNMSLNAFYQWARDAELTTARFEQKDLDVIWIAVNAPHRGSDALSTLENKSRLLNRNEFVQALVRIAMERHPSMPASESVARLCQAIEPNLPREALQSSNVFRHKKCYLQLVSNALLKHEPTLRALFAHYASTSKEGAYRHDALLSCGEWLSLLQDLGLFQSLQLTLPSAKLLFLWSRIRAATHLSLDKEKRLRNLAFEDFLEALVRLSEMLALPTDAELSEAHAEDAGQYMLHFAAGAPRELDQFVRSRRREWWQPPLQRAWRCIDHMLAFFVRIVENSTSRIVFGQRDHQADQAEVVQFETRRRGGRKIVKRGISKRFDPEGLAHSIVHTMGSVEEKTLAALSRVALFDSLGGDQLQELLALMVEAVFHPGDYIYEQGDHGDAFFVILQGRAAALRVELPDPQPDPVEEDADDEGAGNGASQKVPAQVSICDAVVQGIQPSEGIRYGRPKAPEVICLCELEEGAFFGERCLLHDESRYESMKALTNIRTLCITREQFQSVKCADR